jgi:hypothetical protein
MFLEDMPFLWYEYSGSVPDLLSTHAHTYSLDSMVAWAAGRGFSYLVLGGAGDPRDPDDGVGRFKRGFSPLRRTSLQLRKVHCAGRLEMLLRAKERYDRSTGRETRTDWFPSYWLD